MALNARKGAYARGSLWERLTRYFTVGGGCWEWTGLRNSAGYGLIRSGQRRLMAHRALYEFLVDPVPEGLEMDHLCRNRKCVNPDHLEPVTHRVNMLRGQTLPAANVAKTECPRGHPYDGLNTRLWRGQRHCRECNKLAEERRQPRCR
jgi:hypothetical protein